jgi:hypothetical protein
MARDEPELEPADLFALRSAAGSGWFFGFEQRHAEIGFPGFARLLLAEFLVDVWILVFGLEQQVLGKIQRQIEDW